MRDSSRRYSTQKTTTVQNTLCTQGRNENPSRKNSTTRSNKTERLSLVRARHLVPKKSLDGKHKYRFCVDFRALNAVTKFNPYPRPAMDEAASTLFGSKYFSVLDCFSGFYRLISRKNTVNVQRSQCRPVITSLRACPSV
jgi:hypothetical protein